MPLGLPRIRPEQILRYRKLEHSVAEKFEPLVMLLAAVFIHIRTVRERLLEQLAVRKCNPELSLQSIKFSFVHGEAHASYFLSTIVAL